MGTDSCVTSWFISLVFFRLIIALILCINYMLGSIGNFLDFAVSKTNVVGYIQLKSNCGKDLGQIFETYMHS